MIELLIGVGGLIVCWIAYRAGYRNGLVAAEDDEYDNDYEPEEFTGV
jgi:hypothetical protein